MNVSKSIFTVICLCSLGYMIYLEIERFLENNDSSSISFRKFNKSPKDEYPTFTICIGTIYYLEIFDNVYLNQTFNLSSKIYSEVLRGIEKPNVICLYVETGCYHEAVCCMPLYKKNKQKWTRCIKFCYDIFNS